MSNGDIRAGSSPACSSSTHSVASGELSRLANTYGTRYNHDRSKSHTSAYNNQNAANANQSCTNAGDQTSNFSHIPDGTGVEAVSDIMPTEMEFLVRAIMDARGFEEIRFENEWSLAGKPFESYKPVLRILDFGCGDGRYLPAFFRIAEQLSNSEPGVRGTEFGATETFRFMSLEILFVDVSPGALEELKKKIRRWEMARPPGDPVMDFLRFRFLATDPMDTAEEVELKIKTEIDMSTNSSSKFFNAKPFHLCVCGWGVLSCIPEIPHDSNSSNSSHPIMLDDAFIRKPPQFSFLKMLARVGYSLLNIVSTKNNFVKEQRRYNAMRNARREVVERMEGVRKRTCVSEAERQQHESEIGRYQRQLIYLEEKLGLAAYTEDSFYYGKHNMFYSAVNYAEEQYRTERAFCEGYSMTPWMCDATEKGHSSGNCKSSGKSCPISVQIKICNILNFFDILSHPRKRKLNDCLIKLCEQDDDAWISKKCRWFLFDGCRRGGFLESCQKEDKNEASNGGKNPVFFEPKEERINQVARYFLVYAHSYG